MTTSTKHFALSLVISGTMAFFAFSSCSGGSNPDGNISNGDSTVVKDSTSENISGSCYNDKRPKDDQPAATVITKDQSLELINAFGAKFYGTEFNALTVSEPISSRISSDNPSRRVGAFISKYMLDALFEQDPTANGVMVYLGHGPANDGSVQMQYIVTPAKMKNNAVPALPADGSGVYLKIVDDNWCPINCDDLH